MLSSPQQKSPATDESNAEKPAHLPRLDKSRTARSVLTAQDAATIYHMKHIAKHTTEAKLLPSSSSVASAYGVSPKTIRDIWNGRTWRDVVSAVDRGVPLPLLGATAKTSALDASNAAADQPASLHSADRFAARPPGRPKGSRDKQPRRSRAGKFRVTTPSHSVAGTARPARRQLEPAGPFKFDPAEHGGLDSAQSRPPPPPPPFLPPPPPCGDGAAWAERSEPSRAAAAATRRWGDAPLVEPAREPAEPALKLECADQGGGGSGGGDRHWQPVFMGPEGWEWPAGSESAAAAAAADPFHDDWPWPA